MADRASDSLVDRARAGEPAAVGELFETYRRGVFRFLYYRVGDHQAAEDLLGELFLRLIQALPSYGQRKRIPFQAWVYRIARNMTVDHYRRRSVRNQVGLDDHLPSPDPGPEAVAEHRLTSERLHKALWKLTDPQREVIVLRFVAEMPISHVAATMGKSETAIKALQRRGLDALKAILADMGVSYG